MAWRVAIWKIFDNAAFNQIFSTHEKRTSAANLPPHRKLPKRSSILRISFELTGNRCAADVVDKNRRIPFFFSALRWNFLLLLRGSGLSFCHSHIEYHFSGVCWHRALTSWYISGCARCSIVNLCKSINCTLFDLWMRRGRRGVHSHPNRLTQLFGKSLLWQSITNKPALCARSELIAPMDAQNDIRALQFEPTIDNRAPKPKMAAAVVVASRRDSFLKSGISHPFYRRSGAALFSRARCS